MAVHPSRRIESQPGAKPASKGTAKSNGTAKKKSAAKKTGTRKKSATKEPSKKAAAVQRHTYSRASADDVHAAMHEMHEGQLQSGRGGEKVTNPKQAVAIGLTEARRSGKKVPPNPSRPKKKS